MQLTQEKLAAYFTTHCSERALVTSPIQTGMYMLENVLLFCIERR